MLGRQDLPNSFVNGHSSECLTDYRKGTLGTATCNGLPSQQWTGHPDGTVTTFHPDATRCLTMPPMDSSSAGQIFGRALANGSFALLFYNSAPATAGAGATSSIAIGSLCCDSQCWAELSSGVPSVNGTFKVEDVWSGERNATVVVAGRPFCVDVGAAGESSRTFRLDPA